MFLILLMAFLFQSLESNKKRWPHKLTHGLFLRRKTTSRQVRNIHHMVWIRTLPCKSYLRRHHVEVLTACEYYLLLVYSLMIDLFLTTAALRSTEATWPMVVTSKLFRNEYCTKTPSASTIFQFSMCAIVLPFVYT